MENGKIYIDCEVNFKELEEGLVRARILAEELNRELSKIHPKWYDLVFAGIRQLFLGKKQ